MRFFAFHIVLILLGRFESKYFPSSYGLIVGKNGLFNLGMATNLREGKL